MSIDLTKVDKPFGELDQATQWALIGAHYSGKQIQQRCDVSDFHDIKAPSFSAVVIYRLAPPEPVKETREWRMGVSAYWHSEPIISAGHKDTEGWHKGTTTVDFEDGKPVRIVWEAST